MPLGQPVITGPLSGLPPAMFDAGFGNVAVNGILAGETAEILGWIRCGYPE